MQESAHWLSATLSFPANGGGVSRALWDTRGPLECIEVSGSASKGNISKKFLIFENLFLSISLTMHACTLTIWSTSEVFEMFQTTLPSRAVVLNRGAAAH